MKAVILAGGLGTRISEESSMRPKPMIEIGGKPILWHIMKIYSSHGINDFVVCCGYKGYVIKEYFANYFLHMSDVTFDMQNNKMEVHQRNAEPWRVTLVDTGDNTLTGGRLKRIADYVKDEPEFCFTYGDGVADIDIGVLVAFHKQHGKRATVTAVQPPGRYGALNMDGKTVRGFIEKPQGDGGWINGGFFVLSPECIDLIANDSTSWEGAPDETTACKFRHLLEQHELGKRLFEEVGRHLQTHGMKVSTGTIVDATIISAPSSTKNRDKARDPEMHQTKKGNQWHFGMKAHIGVDSKTKLIHSVVATPANEHDKHSIPDLLHGNERRVYGDSAYSSQKALIAEAAPKARDFTNQKGFRNRGLTEREQEKNRRKSSVRAKVEHAFLIIKRIFGFAKVSYRGMMKNGNRLFVVAALANLYMARHHLLRLPQERCV